MTDVCVVKCLGIVSRAGSVLIEDMKTREVRTHHPKYIRSVSLDIL